jgi:myo-inositol 2-dehydrogenase/D-chiro-inositol 1-dehydrogenase
MRFGLIGYGAWGRQHALAIASLPGLELAAITCGSEESAAAAARDHPQARITQDWRALLADAAIEAVSVAAPNHLHAEVAIAALRAGKDVLLEKPMACSAAECDALLAAERESGRLVSVGHELRQSAQWGRVKQLVEGGTIGEPLFMNVSLFRNFYRTGAGGWRYDPGRVGSWLLEEAVHYFDLALWYFEQHGDPVALHAIGNRRAGSDTRPGRGEGMHDNVSVLLRWANGAYVSLNHSVAGFEHHLVVELTGGEGAIRTHWSGTMDRDHRAAYELRVQPRGFAFERGVRECERVSIARSGEVVELKEQIRLTAEAFRQRRVLVSAAESRKRVLVCLAAERSILEGREVGLAF